MLGLSYASRLSPRLESELATLFTPPPLGSDTPVILTNWYQSLVSHLLRGLANSISKFVRKLVGDASTSPSSEYHVRGRDEYRWGSVFRWHGFSPMESAYASRLSPRLESELSTLFTPSPSRVGHPGNPYKLVSELGLTPLTRIS